MLNINCIYLLSSFACTLQAVLTALAVLENVIARLRYICRLAAH